MGNNESRGSARRDTLNLLDYIILDESGVEIDRAMARTLNVSERGILVETHIPLAVEQKLLITLGLRNDLSEFKGRVAHCKSCASETYCCGIEFVDISPGGLTTLRNFLAAFNAQHNPA